MMAAPEVFARLYILDKQFKAAEAIYLEHNQLDEAIDMYKRLHLWDDALGLAEAKAHPGLETLRAEHSRWLLESGQEEKAGAILESEGDLQGALDMYLKAGLATRASRLVQSRGQLLSDPDQVSRVAGALLRGEFFEQAGELFERASSNTSSSDLGMGQGEEDRISAGRALDCYRKAGNYARAVELARREFPGQVVHLEEEWGDHLAENKQLDAAINHYIEAGRAVKALDAAVAARQWKKAVQIVEVVDDDDGGPGQEELLADYFRKLAQHFASVKEFGTAERFFLRGGQTLAKEAVEMYNAAGMWEEAHRLASRIMDPSEVSRMYVAQAGKLESEGRCKEAEKLYVSVGEPDLAIAMYKKQRQFDNMTRLVQVHHPDLLQSTHSHLAQELEREGNHRAAEKHFVEAGDWKAAVHMYRAVDAWEEAHRVAGAHGGPNAGRQVAFLWAKTLGGESAVRLLGKFGLLEHGVDYACETYQFEFAFELARLAAKDKTEEIHYKFAMALEDEGKFQEAEVHFVKAKKPKEAVLMYVHNQDWDNAQRVAEQHDPDSVSDVLVGQAKVAFESGDLPRFESLLLRAQRPELAVKQYKDNGMWAEALRVCKEYLPHRLKALQEEHAKEDGMSLLGGPVIVGVGRDQDSTILAQGRKFEEAGDYPRAVECYARSADNPAALARAAEIAGKFLDVEAAAEAARRIGPLLIKVGRHAAAAQLYMGVEMIREAVDAFLGAREWAKARKVAAELEPGLEPYVEQKYKEFLRGEGKADQLASVDLVSALDMCVEQGQWDKALDMAAKANAEAKAAAGGAKLGSGSASEVLLHKYVAAYATQCIREGKALKALKLYQAHGAPALPQNYNIYRRMASDVFKIPSSQDREGKAFHVWAALRDVLFDLVQNLAAAAGGSSPVELEEFREYLVVAHYLATRSACQTQPKALGETAAKLAVALLRHGQVGPPADKVFYEAGVYCRDAGWSNMAFVFLNRYLDLYEAIEEGGLDVSMMDNSDFLDTDIPVEVPLPETPHLQPDEHEAIKEWVLAVSMDQKVEQQLPTDERGIFVGSLTSSSFGRSAAPCPPCVISGYPVLPASNRVEFANEGMVAVKEEWNKFVMAAKMVTDNEVQDVLKFVGTWCGMGGDAPSFSFK